MDDKRWVDMTAEERTARQEYVDSLIPEALTDAASDEMAWRFVDEMDAAGYRIAPKGECCLAERIDAERRTMDEVFDRLTAERDALRRAIGRHRMEAKQTAAGAATIAAGTLTVTNNTADERLWAVLGADIASERCPTCGHVDRGWVQVQYVSGEWSRELEPCRDPFHATRSTDLTPSPAEVLARLIAGWPKEPDPWDYGSAQRILDALTAAGYAVRPVLSDEERRELADMVVARAAASLNEVPKQ